jgi:hypothetical protein
MWAKKEGVLSQALLARFDSDKAKYKLQYDGEEIKIDIIF